MEQERSAVARERCPQCRCPLDPRYYFCPRCARPHRPVDELLTPSLPPYEDLETRLRLEARSAWVMFFSFLTVLGLASTMAVTIWGAGNEEARQLFVTLAVSVTTVVFLFGGWEEVRPQLGRTGFRGRAAWIGLLVLVPLLGLNFAYHGLLAEWLGPHLAEGPDYFSEGWGGVMMVCVIPAVFEELGFRGLIQREFEKVVNPPVAIAVGSILFSIAHFSFLSAPYLMLAGALFGWLRWRTGSLYPPILAHFLHNLVVITWS